MDEAPNCCVVKHRTWDAAKTDQTENKQFPGKVLWFVAVDIGRGLGNIY